jgi:hypothetical protein
MKRREDIPISKHTLNLFEGDYQRLQDLYPKLGAGKIVRALVRAHLRKIEERTNQRNTTDLDIDLGEVMPEAMPGGLQVKPL